MDEAARLVLTKYKVYIKQNLHLENNVDVLDYLEAKELLTSDNVELINADKTNGDKISRLITILQHKGPAAFDIFLEALTETNTKFLADDLKLKYEEEIENLKHCSNEAVHSDKEETNIELDEELEDDTNKHPKNRLNLENSLRLPVYTNFNRRFSVQITCSQSRLINIHHKLKMHLFNMNERELSFGSPAPVTLEMVENLMDRILKIQQDCFHVLQVVNQKSLLSHVKDLRESKDRLQKTVNNKEDQNKRHTNKIFKLDHKCKELERTIKQLEGHLADTQEENVNLKKIIENSKEEDEQENEKSENLVKNLEAENKELKLRIAQYESQINELTEKVTSLEGMDDTKMAETEMTMSQSNNPNTSKQAKSLDDIEKNEFGIKNKKDVTIHAEKESTTLQECKDVCQATDVSKLNKLRAKILFVGSSGGGTNHRQYTSMVNMTHSEHINNRHRNNSETHRPDTNGRVFDGHEAPVTSQSDHGNVSSNRSEAKSKLNERYTKHNHSTGTLIKGKIKSPFKRHPSVVRGPTRSTKPMK